VTFQVHCLPALNAKMVFILNLEVLTVKQFHFGSCQLVDGVLSPSQLKKAQDSYSQLTMNTDVLTVMLAIDTMRKD